MRLALRLLALVHIILLAPGVVVLGCPPLCFCSPNPLGGTQVDCTAKSLVAVPAGLAALGDVTKLQLSDNRIAAISAADFTGLGSTLTEIFLISNVITEIPDSTFSGLPLLTSLTLANNDITSIGRNAFAAMPKLSFLALSDNKLTDLPADLFAGNSELFLLTLSGNAIGRLPQQVFRGLASLGVLHIHNNDLTTLPAGVFESLPQLQNLNLQFNQLTHLPATAITGLGNLRELDLLGNKLTSLESGVFGQLTSLNTLYLANNAITTIADDAFSVQPALSKLCLANNPLACCGNMTNTARLSALDTSCSRGAAVCQSPPSLAGTQLQTVGSLNLSACPSPVDPGDSSSASTNIALIVGVTVAAVCVLVLVAVAAVVYRNGGRCACPERPRKRSHHFQHSAEGEGGHSGIAHATQGQAVVTLPMEVNPMHSVLGSQGPRSQPELGGSDRGVDTPGVDAWSVPALYEAGPSQPAQAQPVAWTLDNYDTGTGAAAGSSHAQRAWSSEYETGVD